MSGINLSKYVPWVLQILTKKVLKGLNLWRGTLDAPVRKPCSAEVSHFTRPSVQSHALHTPHRWWSQECPQQTSCKCPSHSLPPRDSNTRVTDNPYAWAGRTEDTYRCPDTSEMLTRQVECTSVSRLTQRGWEEQPRDPHVCCESLIWRTLSIQHIKSYEIAIFGQFFTYKNCSLT